MIYVIKVRERKGIPNRYTWFLSGKGGLNRLRQASREYIRERVTGQRREVRRETDAEIREAVNNTKESATCSR